eukprot:3819720-Rhodomonas_salina.4
MAIRVGHSGHTGNRPPPGTKSTRMSVPGIAYWPRSTIPAPGNVPTFGDVKNTRERPCATGTVNILRRSAIVPSWPRVLKW